MYVLLLQLGNTSSSRSMRLLVAVTDTLILSRAPTHIYPISLRSQIRVSTNIVDATLSQYVTVIRDHQIVFSTFGLWNFQLWIAKPEKYWQQHRQYPWSYLDIHR